MCKTSYQRQILTTVLACAALLLVTSHSRAVDAPKGAPADKLYNGNALYNMKLYTAAIPEYRAFLAQNPQDQRADEANYGIALSLYALGNYAEAEPLFKQLVAAGKFGDKQQQAVLLGECILRLRGPAEAEKVFAEAASLTSVDNYQRDMALGYLTECLHRQEKWQESVSVADRALKVLPQGELYDRVGYQGAMARYQLKQYAAAAAALETLLPAVTNKPIGGQVAFLLGESLREDGKLEASEKAYQFAAAKTRGRLQEEALFRLGYTQFHLGRFLEAEGTLQTLLGASPSNRVAEANLYLGRAALERKNFVGAVPPLQQVSQGTTVFAAEATLWLSRVYSRQNQLDGALNVLTNAVPRFTADPLLPDLLFEQAGYFMTQQKYRDAATSFARIGRAWPRYDEAVRLNALCLHRLKDYANSIVQCDLYLSTFTNKAPAEADIRFLKAENLFLSNPAAPDGALKLYREFMAAYPKHPTYADAVNVRVGQTLQSKGQWSDALPFLTPLLSRVPQPGEEKVFLEVPFLVGDCYFRLQKWAEAVEPLDSYVKKATAAHGNVDTALLELALANVKLGKPLAAMPSLEQLVLKFPKSLHMPLALVELGRLYYEAKRVEARLTLQRVPNEFAKAPQRPQAEYYLGWLNLDAKQDAMAETNFTQVVQLAPTDPLAPDSRLQLGMITLRAQRFKDAWAHFLALETSHTNFAKLDEAYYSGGIALARMNTHDLAVAQFQTVLDRYPKSSMADRAAYEMAWCQRRANRNAEAIKAYDRLLTAYPNSTLAERARFEKAELTFGAADYDAVVKQLGETIAGAADKTVKEGAMYRLGWAYMSKGDATAAAKAFEAMLAEYPDSERAATAHYQAGEMRVKLKDFESALTHFTAALAAKNPKEIREHALLRQGEMQTQVGKFTEAGVSYKLFQVDFPTSKWIQQARFGSGWASENQKQYDVAIAEYRKVIAERATDEISARAQFQIGECLFSLKRYDEALQELVRVDVNYRFPDWSGKALYEVARVLEAKGDGSGALEKYRAVMDRFPKEDVGAAARKRMFELQAQGVTAPTNAVAPVAGTAEAKAAAKAARAKANPLARPVARVPKAKKTQE